jgi:outer membrane receptor protein involved in Fe transport
MQIAEFQIRTSIKISTIFFMLFCLTTVIFAQSSTLTGLVKDQNEAVVPGAAVIAVNTGSGRTLTTVTNENGKYEFKNLTVGQYRMKVRKSGFSDIGMSVSIGSAENIVQDFSISLGSLQEQVTVTAAKGLRATSEIPQSVTVVSDTEIEQRRPVGISDAFDKAPSVLSSDPNPYRARPQIRGLQSSRILITVDGERLNSARFAADFVGVSPSLVDTSQIQGVEVVAGSSSSLYGSDAIGGTVNIITKGADREPNGRRVTVKLDGDYGSNNNYRKGAAAIGYSENKVAFRLNMARFQFPNYHLGGEGITKDEVLRFGNFARQAGNAIGQNVVGSYAVYDFAGNGEVLNSQARGYLGGADLQLFPDDTQTFRLRFQTNRYKDLGVGFSGIPTGVNRANTGYSNVDKISARYEKREIANWFPRFQFSGFWQEYKRSLNEVRSNIVVGSSCVGVVAPGPPVPTCPASTTLTGNSSAFVKSLTSATVSQALAHGWDAQFNFIPFKNSLLITGFNYNNEDAHDNFGQQNFSAATGAVTSTITDVRNVPDTNYKNIGWYNQFEYTPVKYVRFTGGFRFDDWKTQAKPTIGFPQNSVISIINAVLPSVISNPGTLNASGVNGILGLIAGSAALKTNSKVWTYNFGVTGFINGGINPYFRYSTSFREPDLTSRFLVRNFFGSPSPLSFVGLRIIEIRLTMRPEPSREATVCPRIRQSECSAERAASLPDRRRDISP